MRFKSVILILFLLGFSYSREYTRGVIQSIGASFCMDLCSMYQLIPDIGYTYTNLTATPIIILEEYAGQHVEIWGEETWCVECGALDVDEIILIQDTPPECTDNSNCGDCFDAGCFWQPVAPVGYQCNDECFIMDTECYGQGSSWIAECPDSNCCDTAELAEENCGGLGCFIPQCTDNCEWGAMQCWSSTGYCWCVDEEGNEIGGTSQHVWEGYPECEESCTENEFDCNGDGTECIPFQYYCDQTDFPCYDTWCFEPDCQNGADEIVEDCCAIDALAYIEDGICEEQCTQGDLTEDGAVNVLDVVFMVNIILQLPSENDPWNFWLCAGDFNGDGTINVLDVISLVNLILNPSPEECNIIPEVGPCDGICPTYYYNQDSGQCEEFITGCCGVEAFDTQQSCQDICE